MFPAMYRTSFSLNPLRNIQLMRKCSTKINRSTICNVSTGRGRSAIAVVRVSGSKVQEILRLSTIPSNIPKSRNMRLRHIIDPSTKEVLDHGLVVYFPGPHSFTGEDLCEFHLHGSPAVVDAVLKGLTKIKNVVLAKPGEFTRRAFYNKKIDLTEVEAIGDLLCADTEEQRKQAQAQYRGVLSVIIKKWNKELIALLAQLEAHIDFSETEDVSINFSEIKLRLEELIKEINDTLKTKNMGIIIRDGCKVVIYGAPNAGKSSLFNALSMENTAIVSNIPGTTRDVLEAKINVYGYPINLYDTAGLKPNSTDEIEVEGISRAMDNLTDFRTILHLLVISAPDLIQSLNNNFINLQNFLIEHLNQINATSLLRDDLHKGIKNSIFKKNTLVVVNKIDLCTKEELEKITSYKGKLFYISCKPHYNITELADNIACIAKESTGDGDYETPRITSLRQYTHLKECVSNLNEANFLLDHRNNQVDFAIICNYLRMATQKLGYVTGARISEEVLDIIFEDFCIGK